MIRLTYTVTPLELQIPFRNLLAMLLLFLNVNVYGQETISEILKQYNDQSVPYISTEELSKLDSEVILLDAREFKEFNVSHLKNAIHVGYDDFNLDKTTAQLAKKTSQIVVYCSVGVRSEDIAEKLKNAGFNNVYNLYGGIFEWKNNGLPVYNSKNYETDRVHAYSKKWGKWLLKGTKVYE
ncbi:rhodanese-like domain-containing protein [Winogradskyella aurantia]|uniref:Rhodanese n=1 Tax=Winogradskyella aurantia TaxID=1915063 RepID=A0A265UVF1_9FLAO|nr:rhodanese-like domain-containing protein [Winogradskyella aurantia]OZV69301.1 rhodanese [Winogradskyella aurantia]